MPICYFIVLWNVISLCVDSKQNWPLIKKVSVFNNLFPIECKIQISTNYTLHTLNFSVWYIYYQSPAVDLASLFSAKCRSKDPYLSTPVSVPHIIYTYWLVLKYNYRFCPTWLRYLKTYGKLLWSQRYAWDDVQGPQPKARVECHTNTV